MQNSPNFMIWHPQHHIVVFLQHMLRPRRQEIQKVHMEFLPFNLVPTASLFLFYSDRHAASPFAWQLPLSLRQPRRRPLRHPIHPSVHDAADRGVFLVSYQHPSLRQHSPRRNQARNARFFSHAPAIGTCIKYSFSMVLRLSCTSPSCLLLNARPDSSLFYLFRLQPHKRRASPSAAIADIRIPSTNEIYLTDPFLLSVLRCGLACAFCCSDCSTSSSMGAAASWPTSARSPYLGACSRPLSASALAAATVTATLTLRRILTKWDRVSRGVPNLAK